MRRDVLIADGLLLAIFAVLPVVGLAVGPGYAAMIFGLGGVRLLVSRGAGFSLDPVLTVLAVLFALWCWASVSWSVMPASTVSGALQSTAVMAGALVFLGASRTVSPRIAALLPPVMTAAFVLGALVIAADAVVGYASHGRYGLEAGTKFNRGVLYSMLLAGPVLAWWAERRDWRKVTVVAAALVVTIVVSVCTTAQLALPIAVVVLLVAYWRSGLTGKVLAAATTAMALSLPWLLRGIETYRLLLIPHIKPSAGARLEIWDFMSARVLDRPFLGWGLQVSHGIPATPSELAHYVYITKAGIYPHNQWLELWVDLGPVAVLLAIALIWVAYRRIGRLSAPFRPYALMVFVIVLVISSVDFQVNTDSWWAALAAQAFLFRILDKSRVGVSDSLSASRNAVESVQV